MEGCIEHLVEEGGGRCRGGGGCCSPEDVGELLGSEGVCSVGEVGVEEIYEFGLVDLQAGAGVQAVGELAGAEMLGIG